MKLIMKTLNLKCNATLSHCLKGKRNTESINPKVSKTNNGKTRIPSKCAICGSKKSIFIKKLKQVEC